MGIQEVSLEVLEGGESDGLMALGAMEGIKNKTKGAWPGNRLRRTSTWVR